MVTEERTRRFARWSTQWPGGRPSARTSAGWCSWARGTACMDSDVDIVVLTDDPRYAQPDVWTGLLGGDVVRLAEWGPVREVRVRRPSGFEVELGVAPVSWADTDPLDAGTRRVMSDGHLVVHDPAGLVAALSAACRAPRAADTSHPSR